MHGIAHSLAALVLLGAPAAALQEAPIIQESAPQAADLGTMQAFLTDYASIAGLSITFNEETAKALEGTKAKLEIEDEITGPEAGDLLLDILALHGFEGEFIGPAGTSICKVSIPAPKDAGLHVVLTTQLVESELPTEIEWEGAQSVLADGGCCDLFPAPTKALEMHFEEKSAQANLMTLIEAYAALTDQKILISTETRMLAEGCDPGIRGDVSIPAGEVQSVFESILIANDFVIHLVRTEAPRLIVFESLKTGARNTAKSNARFVSSQDAAHLAHHPAMLFTTIVEMPSVDVRQASNSLRTMLTDANTQQMLPIGNTSQMLLTGLGGNVAEMVTMLKQIESAARPKLDLSPAPTQGGAARAGAPAPVPTHCTLFPVANGSLKIAAKDGKPTKLSEIVDQYAALTGQGVTTSSQTRQLLEASLVDVQDVDVPADEVQSYFEHLLRANDYTLSILRDREPRLVSIISLRTGDRNTARSTAMVVDARHIDHFKEHPALLIETTVHMPNSDVRQISNSMRTMLTDANTQQLLPAGNSHSMVITGFGDGAADLARILRGIDAEAGEALATSLEVVVLEHTQAPDIRATLMEMLAPNVSAPGMRGQPANAPQSTKITVDARTNSLLIQAKTKDMPRIKDMIAQLDVDLPVAGGDGSDD